MIPKRAKLYSNSVKISIFLKKITNIALNDPMASGAAAYPQTLVCDMLIVAPVYSGCRLNDMFLIKFF